MRRDFLPNEPISKATEEKLKTHLATLQGHELLEALKACRDEQQYQFLTSTNIKNLEIGHVREFLKECVHLNLDLRSLKEAIDNTLGSKDFLDLAALWIQDNTNLYLLNQHIEKLSEADLCYLFKSCRKAEELMRVLSSCIKAKVDPTLVKKYTSLLENPEWVKNFKGDKDFLFVLDFCVDEGYGEIVEPYLIHFKENELGSVMRSYMNKKQFKIFTKH